MAAAAEAVHLVAKANDDLPDGCAPIELPAFLSRGAPELPERVIGTRIVRCWGFTRTGLPVPDHEQDRILCLNHDPSRGQTPGGSTVQQMDFREISFLARERGGNAQPLYLALSLPALSEADPAYWSPATYRNLSAATVAAYAEGALAAERGGAARAVPDSEREVLVRYEPVVPSAAATKAA